MPADDRADAAACSDPHADAEPAPPVRYRWWVQGLAALTVAATFVLIGIGGHVTSTGSGLAVPDWPTTFGYDMITAPLDVWWDNVGTRVEHAHRLKGTVVGLLSIALAFSLLFTQFRRKWLVVTGFALLGAIIVQGILGGTRVTERSDLLAFLHGVLGQLIFCATVLIASATGRTWLRLAPRVVAWAKQPKWARRMQWLAVAAVGVLVVQLVLGAAVRHAGAGRAIPDFPTAYGRWVPPMSTPDLREAVNAWDAAHPAQAVWLPHQRVDDLVQRGAVAETDRERAEWAMLTKQVHLQFSHRLFAVVVVATVLGLAGWIAWRSPGRGELLAPTMWLSLLIVMQVMLGASTVWTERSPLVATAHQAVGAILLAIATWLAIRVALVTAQPDAALGAAAPQAGERTDRPAQREASPELKGAPA